MKILLSLLMLIVGAQAFAQCPVGIPSAGNPACIPPERSNSPYYQGPQREVSAPVGEWETRWGAFAIDLQKGLGTSKSMRSKRMAQSAAMAQCKKLGGKKCKVEFVYFNQCGVVVAGAKTFSTSAAPTIEHAEEMSMDTCRKSGDDDCHLYFSDCSPAEFVR